MFCSLLAPICLFLLSTTLLQNPSQLNITLLFCRLHPIDYRSFSSSSSPLLFLSQLSPAVIVKVTFSSFASLHLYPYFLMFVFFSHPCKNAFVSVMPLHIFFSSVLSVVYHDRTTCFLLSLLPCFLLCIYFFYCVCSSLISALFVSSSSPPFSTAVIALFISSSAFIFFLLIQCFFCCVMWLFHSLYTFVCSSLTTLLLSCHHFSVMSPIHLPLTSCCVILRSCKQTFPPRLPCTDLSE